MSALPATLTNGFGICWLNGCMRVPSPAASVMARLGFCLAASLIGFGRSNGVQGRHMGNIPCVERLQCWMTQRSLQIGPHPRQVTQILRLAVAHVQPCKYAEDFARALGGERHVDLDELRRIKVGVHMPAAAHVAAEQGKLDLL